MSSLLILGAGGHGRVVADAALEAGFDRVAFLDDSARSLPASPFQVLGPLGDLQAHLRDWQNAIAAVGDNALRLRLHRLAQAAGFGTPPIVHPRAVVSRHADMAGGGFIAAGAVVGVGAALGEAVIVNTLASVDHDCRIEAGVHISPGAHLGGGVAVGSRSWIGIGAAVLPGVRIGADVVVGAGSTVIGDLPQVGTYVGVPARPINKHR